MLNCIPLASAPVSLFCKEVLDDVAAPEDFLAAAVVEKSKHVCDGGLALLNVLTRSISGFVWVW